MSKHVGLLMLHGIACVVAEDLLVFYVLFEVMLLVMYTCVCSYIYNTRSVYALYMLVSYTVVGSSLMACGMLLQYIISGSTSSLHGIDNHA